MAKNFFKNIFNKSSLSKKKSTIDSQKLSDIIIINNNESNFFQQKPFDKYNILSNYYPKIEKKNKKEKNFLDKINELNNKFDLSQEKFALVKSSLEKINEDLFSNLLKQIDCYIEEIQRLNKKLVKFNNDNKEDIIHKLNKKILENEKTIRNYEHKIRENANKEEKLTKEIEYYKKRIIFYKNKININLISRKISNDNEEIKEKNNETNLKLYNHITSNMTKPNYTKNNNLYQSSRRIIQIRNDKRLMSTSEFPSFSGNKNSNLKNKLLSKRKTINEKENNISEFLNDKESRDDSNKNLVNLKNKTTIENINFSNDSSDNINEQNDSIDSDSFENLKINENINDMNKTKSYRLNDTSYMKHNKNKSGIFHTKSFNIKEKDKKDNVNKISEYKDKKYKSNSIISDFQIDNLNNQRYSTNVNLDMKLNHSFNPNNKNNIKSSFKHQNTLAKSTFQKSNYNNETKNNKNKSLFRSNTNYGTINNQNKDKNEKNKIIENKKDANITKSKNAEKEKLKDENNIKNENNIDNKKKRLSKSSKKNNNIYENNKKQDKKITVNEKDLKKILKDMNKDYNDDIEMLTNQENQIKFLLNLIDINN